MTCMTSQEVNISFLGLGGARGACDAFCANCQPPSKKKQVNTASSSYHKKSKHCIAVRYVHARSCMAALILAVRHTL